MHQSRYLPYSQLPDVHLSRYLGKSHVLLDSLNTSFVMSRLDFAPSKCEALLRDWVSSEPMLLIPWRELCQEGDFLFDQFYCIRQISLCQTFRGPTGPLPIREISFVSTTTDYQSGTEWTQQKFAQSSYITQKNDRYE